MNSLLFLYFPDLWNSDIYIYSMFSCYSLPNMKMICVYYLLLINPYKFLSGAYHESDFYASPIT